MVVNLPACRVPQHFRISCCISGYNIDSFIRKVFELYRSLSVRMGERGGGGERMDLKKLFVNLNRMERVDTKLLRQSNMKRVEGTFIRTRECDFRH